MQLIAYMRYSFAEWLTQVSYASHGYEFTRHLYHKAWCGSHGKLRRDSAIGYGECFYYGRPYDYEGAADWFKWALENTEVHDSSYNANHCNYLLGKTLLKLERYAEALECLKSHQRNDGHMSVESEINECKKHLLQEKRKRHKAVIGEEKHAELNSIKPLRERASTTSNTLETLETLVGLRSVKDEILRISARVKFDAEQGITSTYRHFMFTGNPGTGKTTVARLLGQLLHDVGFLSSTKFVEASRATLIGKYLGQTPSQTREVIESALDGVLFIDEAHMLVPSDSAHEDYGKEALSEINKAMEDYRNRLVVIFAGYTEPMGRLYRVEPGLQSRITRTISFPDYSPEELRIIFCNEVKSHGLSLENDGSSSINDLLIEQLTRIAAKQGHQMFGNARGVRNIVERLIDDHAFDAMQQKLGRERSKIIRLETVSNTLAAF